MSVEPGQPVLIRNEDPWQFLFENGSTRSGRRGHVHLRVWRSAPDQLTIVLADAYGRHDFFAELILMLQAEHPGDSIEFFFHHPGDWTAQLQYQSMALDDEGGGGGQECGTSSPHAREQARPQPERDRPEDKSGGYGGA